MSTYLFVLTFVQCLLEICEEAFIESCFEELFEEEEEFAEELEQYLSSLTQEQVGSLVHQLDAVCLADSQPDADLVTKVRGISLSRVSTKLLPYSFTIPKQ